MIRFRPEEGAGGEAPEGTPEVAPATEGASAPAPSAPVETGWSGPSQNEWQQTQQAIQYMAQMLTPQEEYEEEDTGEINIDEYIARAVDSRLTPVKPLLDASVKERGERVMAEIFDAVEAEPEVGKFDRKLAERMAQSYLAEYGGDPLKATQEAAREAARIRKEERAAGETSYRERLQRGPQDYEPGTSGAGSRLKAPAKSYDEVIELWSGETEA